jgi:hypothetical protein
MADHPRALGRRVPQDWQHVDKYPLSALAEAELPVAVPVVIGVSWFTDFDSPVHRDGAWWIGLNAQRLGTVRGGHCVVLEPGAKAEKDAAGWQEFYDQVDEGICVGEGSSRCMSLLNRRRYQPRWLYDRCKERDGFPNEEGTEVRVGMDVLRTLGHVPAKARESQGLTPGEYDDRKPDPAAGIRANRWATSIADVLRALGTPTLEYATILNSWGDSYPRRVRVPAATLDRLLHEQGEFAIVTDR